jgi:DNA-binding NtrC family response regulator
LTSVGGNRRKAAELLGIAERTLYDKLKRYGASPTPTDPVADRRRTG